VVIRIYIYVHGTTTNCLFLPLRRARALYRSQFSSYTDLPCNTAVLVILELDISMLLHSKDLVAVVALCAICVFD